MQNLICWLFGHNVVPKYVRQVCVLVFHGNVIGGKCKRCGGRFESHIPYEGTEVKYDEECSLSPDCKCENCISYEGEWADRI